MRKNLKKTIKYSCTIFFICLFIISIAALIVNNFGHPYYQLTLYEFLGYLLIWGLIYKAIDYFNKW